MTDSELEQFIASNIHSVEEVEILALLNRSPETFWSADAMSQQLGIKSDVVAARARDLVRRGLLRAAESGPPGQLGTGLYGSPLPVTHGQP